MIARNSFPFNDFNSAKKGIAQSMSSLIALLRMHSKCHFGGYMKKLVSGELMNVVGGNIVDSNASETGLEHADIHAFEDNGGGGGGVPKARKPIAKASVAVASVAVAAIAP